MARRNSQGRHRHGMVHEDRRRGRTLGTRRGKGQKTGLKPRWKRIF